MIKVINQEIKEISSFPKINSNMIQNQDTEKTEPKTSWKMKIIPKSITNSSIASHDLDHVVSLQGRQDNFGGGGDRY